MSPTNATLVYCFSGEHVLLARRRTTPYPGLWVAPGGKVEPGEAPWECAARELREETGLIAGALTLRAVILETSPLPDWQWLLFVYAALSFSGSVASDEREGELRWWCRRDVAPPHVPPSDAVFFPYVQKVAAPPYEGRYVYDDALRLVAVHDNAARVVPAEVPLP